MKKVAGRKSQVENQGTSSENGVKKVAGRKSQVENQGTSSENGVKKVAGRKWKVKEPPPKPSFCLLSPSAAGFTEKAIKTFDL